MPLVSQRSRRLGAEAFFRSHAAALGLEVIEPATFMANHIEIAVPGTITQVARGHLPHTEALEGYLVFTSDSDAGGWSVVIADILQEDNGFAFAVMGGREKWEKAGLDVSATAARSPSGSRTAARSHRRHASSTSSSPTRVRSSSAPTPAGQARATLTVRGRRVHAAARASGCGQTSARPAPSDSLLGGALGRWRLAGAAAAGRGRLRVAAAEIPDHVGLGDALAAASSATSCHGSCASGSSSQRASSIASSAPRSAGPRCGLRAEHRPQDLDLLIGELDAPHPAPGQAKPSARTEAGANSGIRRLVGG